MKTRSNRLSGTPSLFRCVGSEHVCTMSKRLIRSFNVAPWEFVASPENQSRCLALKCTIAGAEHIQSVSDCAAETCERHAFSSSFHEQTKKRFCSVYSFSWSCPKTVSRTREVFPTGSTTLLRLQLSRTRDCAHRSRHVGLLLFLFCFFFLLERKVPAQSKLKE